MSALTHLSLTPHGASFPVLVRLGLTLIHTIWEGALVAALLWVALTILRGRSPQVRYLVGCGAALAMMAGMALTFLLVPASGTVSLSPSVERGHNGVVAAAAYEVSSPAGSSAGSGLGVPNAAHSRPAMVGRPSLTGGRRLLVTWGQRGTTLLPSLALAWAAGVLALAGRLIAGCLGVRHLRSHGTSPVEPCWQQRLLALARRMRIGQPVSLRQSASVTTPAVVGWLRPVILLPVGMCAGLSTAQVEMILAHELAHVGRQDYLVNLLLNVVETILFYHPAIWWIAARVREERENACDDLALAASNDDRLGYARALASLEELRLPVLSLALAARGDNGTLLTRVRRLLRTPGTREHAFPSRKTACGLAGTVILCGAVAAFLIVAGLIPARSQEAVGAAAAPAMDAPSPANPHEEQPESAREQMTARVKVTDDTGRPIAGAEVLLRGIRPTHAGDYFGWKQGVAVLTDAQGEAAVIYPRYIEEKRSTGTLCLLVKHPDFCDQEADWHVDGAGAAPKPVPLVRGAVIRVRGHLPDSLSGAARPAIYPKLAAGRFVSRSIQDWHKLDDNTWENRKIAPGDYYLRAAHDNADGTISFSGIQQITAVQDETYTFDLELRRGERIEGRLDDSVPRPIVRGRVIAHLYDAAPGQGAKYLNWDTWREVAPDGTFVFESLPAGTAEITVQCAGFVSSNPSEGNRSDNELTLPQSFAVTPGAANHAVVRMEPAAAVEVEVRNEAGQPVNGALVSFFPNVKFTPGFTTGFNESLGRNEDAVRTGPNGESPGDDPANAGLEAFQTRTDGSGSAAIRDLPAGNQSMFVMDENYELPAISSHGYNRREVLVPLTPGEKKHLVVQVQKKGKAPLTDSRPASSLPSGQTAAPAPTPAAPAVPTPPTALERAWEEYTKVDAEVTRFDRAQQQMKPAGDDQEKQKAMAGFLALRDRYHDACAQFVRLAPTEDSRRPLVLLLSTGANRKATPAEHTAVIDEVLATPTAPLEVQVRALLLRESTAATAAKINKFLASHPQEPRRHELEMKAARIRASDPSSPPASPALPSASPSPGTDHPSGQKDDGAGNLPSSPPAVLPGAADGRSVPASAGSSAGSTGDKSRRDEISRLGMAAVRGQPAALQEMAEIAASDAKMDDDAKKAALYADFRIAFADFGAEAGRGNAAMLSMIRQASRNPDLEGFAVEALGQAAGMGIAEALPPLLDPEHYGILQSSAVGALKPAADAGNVQAIEALAATAADQKLHALWFLAAEGLASAAIAGNQTAIDSLAALATDKNVNVHKTATLALEVAAAKGRSGAQQALQTLTGPGLKRIGAENPSPSRPANEQSIPTSTVVPTDAKARGAEISRLGIAAMQGDYPALEQLTKIAAAATGMNAGEKTVLYADFRKTFAVFGAEAGRGNATVLQTIWQASRIPELAGFAVEAFGQAAGMGNEEALQPLLDPENYLIQRSGAVCALKPAADAGDVQAIEALAATAADQKQHALWFLAADGLRGAAVAGNRTAIDSLAALATDKNLGTRRAAVGALEAAAAKGRPGAQQALHKLRGE